MAKQYGPAPQSARCTVCSHPSLPEINRALIDGVSLRSLAATHNLSVSALFRHTKHLRHQFELQQRQADRAEITQFLDKLELLEFRLDRLFRKAEESHSFHVSLGCLQESFRVLSLWERVRHSQGDRL